MFRLSRCIHMQYINYAKLLSRLFWIRVFQTDLSGNEILQKKALFLSDCYSTALKVWNLLKHIWHLKLYHMHFCVRMHWVFNLSVMTKMEIQVGFRLEVGAQNFLQYIKAMVHLVYFSSSKVASIRFFKEDYTIVGINNY